MLMRVVGAVFVVVLTCGFQTFALRWPATTHVIVLRVLSDRMPSGMPERIQDAAGTWTSEAIRFALIGAESFVQDMGTIRLGSTGGQGHMGTAFMARGGDISRCDVIVADDAWHRERWHLGTEPPPPDRYDVWTQVAHELGHCLGLQHEDGATPPALMRTLIHTGEMQRTLTLDDVRGRDALFPVEQRRGFFGCGKRL